MTDASDAPVTLDSACPERAAAAVRYAAERRKLFLVSTVLGLLAPTLPYLTGAWETAWYALAATFWPLPVRAALFLLGMHLALALVTLPLAYYSGFTLPHAFGQSRQTRRAWTVDWLKATLLGAAFGTLVGGVYLWCATRLDTQWWWAFGLFLSVGTVLLVFLMPYVLVPIFFKMRPLEDAAVVSRIHALARHAGAEVREVCSLDFSRRTADANAAVIGIGRSRRVVLADTLLAEFQPAEVDAVVAHELAHHVYRDVPRLIAAQLGLMWLGLAVAAWLAPAALPVLSVPYLGYVPGYPMLLAVVELFSLVTAPLANWFSRQREHAADLFALRVTNDPRAFAGAMQRIACQNLAELRSPRWAEVLLATHPPLGRRIALAESWKV